MHSFNDNPDGHTETADQALQDRLLADRLPSWLHGASLQQLRWLGDAMSLSLYFTQRAKAVLATISSLEAFAQPRLQLAMDQACGAGHDVTRLQLRWGHREPVVTSQPIGYPVTEAVYRQIPLLEAALGNFTQLEASSDGELAGNRLIDPDDPTRKLPSAARFAAICRELDIGGQYQRHLDACLQPPGPTENGTGEQRLQVLSLFARAHRYSMLADAHVGLIKGALNEVEHQLLVNLCGLHQPLTLEGRPVQAKYLNLLGCQMQQILVLDVRDETYSPVYTSSSRVLVHIPGDPYAPWQAFADLRRFANALGKRLRTPAYQRFFARFVRRRDSQAFFSAVAACYDGLSDLANADLEERLHTCPTPLFDALAQARVRQIKDDAGMIAMATAAVDHEVRQAHAQRLTAEGWTLLTLAGLFVPALGLGMLALTAWQILGEVFHGIEAWHEGDSAEALEQLVNVATDVALVAATAAGVQGVRTLWARSKWVDSLVPARLGDGRQCLWHDDPAPYRSAAPGVQAVRDEAGIYRHGDHAWVEMEGHHYSVEQHTDDGHWYLRARSGYGPRLCHNGAGAWRLWSEQPAQWASTPRLFRRLGGVFGQLDDQQIDSAMLTHDLDASQLRALHVYGQAPDAQLLDSVTRFAIDRRLQVLSEGLREGRNTGDREALMKLLDMAAGSTLDDAGLAELATLRRRALFQGLYEAAQPEPTPASLLLRRQFPGLHELAARALLHDATLAERTALDAQQRVPLRLALAARARVGQIRLVRALEGLYLDAPQTADLARLALGLSEGLPGASQGASWRLFEGSRQGPLLAQAGTQEAGKVVDLVHADGQFQLFDAQGHLLAGPGELFEVMAFAYDEAQRGIMDVGQPFAANLRVRLATLAGARRSQLGHLLGQAPAQGWFRLPQRLDGGRLGYPLSGRGHGRAQALYAMVRSVYPSFDEAQIEAWLAQVRQIGRQVEDEVSRLQAQLAALHSNLNNWCALAGSRQERVDRRSLAEGLLDCWQRISPRVRGGLPIAYRLTIRDLALSSLPDLPESVSFAHVRELSMVAVGISDVPNGFLHAFPAVRILELAGNRLARLPSGLGHLSLLREMDLFGNQIVLDDAQARQLARCTHLQYLNLSFNPLGRALSVQGLSRLRRLHLRATGLESLPRGVLANFQLVLADLRDNRIASLPGDFYRAPAWVSRNIRLDGNPLDDANTARLRAFMQEHGWIVDEEQPSDSSGVRQRWLDAADSLERTDQSSMWDEIEIHEGCQDFISLLGRLLQTAEYQQRGQALATRVFTMLRAMCEHDTLRQELFAQASLPVTCQDSASLAFSGLELRMLVWRARVDAAIGGEQAAFMRLARQLWRLDEVDRIAQRDYEARRAEGADPDQIEVVLAYRVGLRVPLALPAQPSDMLFAEVAGLDQARIDEARDDVLAHETPERLSQALVGRDFWCEHLLQANAARFESLDSAFHSRVEALMNAVEGMPEGRYLEEMKHVQVEREVARRALLLRLTRQAMGDHLEPLDPPQGH
ncbi:NEL-type E3 ubiquitin ligase domain-containing protein [Pseudomonas sp. NPDC089996]|uniref:NEL-type E3 ubiquitin ligase domain-containing protein n=1 Tax=Pseudomonas sp. NPDC089996 TaxID=3364474 RepID=UPI0037FDB353